MRNLMSKLEFENKKTAFWLFFKKSIFYYPNFMFDRHRTENFDIIY
jgi:hypothetical protein